MSKAAAGDLCAVDIPAGGGVGGRGTDWRGRRLSLHYLLSESLYKIYY